MRTWGELLGDAEPEDEPGAGDSRLLRPPARLAEPKPARHLAAPVRVRSARRRVVGGPRGGADRRRRGHLRRRTCSSSGCASGAISTSSTRRSRRRSRRYLESRGLLSVDDGRASCSSSASTARARRQPSASSPSVYASTNATSLSLPPTRFARPPGSSWRSGRSGSGADYVGSARGGDPAAVAFDAVEATLARGRDVAIVDTAGRLHTQVGLMDELKKVRRVIERRLEGAPHETLLVLDATTGQNGLQQARLFHEAVGVTGVCLTKLDGSAKGGIVLPVAVELASREAHRHRRGRGGPAPIRRRRLRARPRRARRRLEVRAGRAPRVRGSLASASRGLGPSEARRGFIRGCPPRRRDEGYAHDEKGFLVNATRAFGPSSARGTSAW